MDMHRLRYGAKEARPLTAFRAPLASRRTGLGLKLAVLAACANGGAIVSGDAARQALATGSGLRATRSRIGLAKRASDARGDA